MVPDCRAIAAISASRTARSPRSAASRRRRQRDARRRGPVVVAGLRRRPHPHGRADLLGSDRHQLLLPGRDQRGHGQLRLHPGAVPRERGRPRHAQPRARRGHQPRRHEGRHQVALGDLPRIPRRARHAAQGHQLRGLHRPLRAPHLRDGPARLHRRGDRGRSQGDGASHQGGDRRRRARLLDHAQRQSHDLGRQAGGEPARHLGRVRDAGRRRWARAWSRSPASRAAPTGDKARHYYEGLSKLAIESGRPITFGLFSRRSNPGSLAHHLRHHRAHRAARAAACSPRCTAGR